MHWLWFFLYFFVLFGLSAYGLHRFMIVVLYLKHSRKKPQPQATFHDLPPVTLQLPCFNEQHVMRRLLRAVAKIDYPQDKLQIQVLDDSTDNTTDICREEVKKLLQQGFDISLIHRTDRTGFKAGALQNALASTKSDYIFILDADFVPDPDILHQTIHYFTDPKIGLIQTRWEHLNRTHNLLTRIEAMFLDGHFELEQTARNRSGRFFTFNGTAGIWRKSCIEDAGGWNHDTLNEDMDISYRAQIKGWKFIFLNDVTTPAELPITMDGFKTQQHRWTKGSIQICKKFLIPIWKSNVPFICKLEATAHLTTNFAYLLLFALLFLILPRQNSGAATLQWFEAHGLSENLLNLPLFFFGNVSIVLFYIIGQKIVRPKTWLTDICFLPLLLALGVGLSINNAKAVIEAIFNKKSPFIRTPKQGDIRDKSSNKPKQTPIKKTYNLLSIKSLTPIVEFAFGIFFSIVILDNILNNNWISVAFLIIFPMGFFYTSLSIFFAKTPLFLKTLLEKKAKRS